MYVYLYVYAHLYHIDIYVNYIYIGGVGIWGLFWYARTPTLIIAWWVGERQAFGLRKIVGSTYFPYGNGRDWFGTQGPKTGNDTWTILAAGESGACFFFSNFSSLRFPKFGPSDFQNADLSGGFTVMCLRKFGTSRFCQVLRGWSGLHAWPKDPWGIARFVMCFVWEESLMVFGTLEQWKKCGCLVFLTNHYNDPYYTGLGRYKNRHKGVSIPKTSKNTHGKLTWLLKNGFVVQRYLHLCVWW